MINRQMQIRFDQQPEDKYKLMLKEVGWRDRTEEEDTLLGWRHLRTAAEQFKEALTEKSPAPIAIPTIG